MKGVAVFAGARRYDIVCRVPEKSLQRSRRDFFRRHHKKPGRYLYQPGLK